MASRFIPTMRKSVGTHAAPEQSMPDNPKTFLNGVYHLLDPVRLSSNISAAVSLARTDPLGGLGAVISTSIAVRDLISPTSRLFGEHALTVMDPASAFSSLSALRSPYDNLTGVAIADPFRGTMSSLASVAGVADSFRTAYGTLPLSTSVVLSTLPMSTAAFGVGVADSLTAASTIASPYLASAASVYSLESSFARIAGSASLPGSMLAAITLPGIPAANLNYLQSGVVSLSSAARATWDALSRDTAVLATASLSFLRTPALELYSTVQVAGAITLPREAMLPVDEEIEEVLEETASAFEARLAALDQDLVEVYRGAIAAIEVGGPDWQRHSMGSLRELTSHVLHKLAPDGELVPSARPSDLHNGQPTRRARLNFIFGAVAGPEIVRFYEADMKAAIALFDLLHGGAHKLGNKATPDQLHYLRGRVVGLIASMLSAQGL